MDQQEENALRSTWRPICAQIARTELNRAFRGFSRLPQKDIRHHADQLSAMLLDEHVQRKRVYTVSDQQSLQDTARTEAMRIRQRIEESLPQESSTTQTGPAHPESTRTPTTGGGPDGVPSHEDRAVSFDLNATNARVDKALGANRRAELVIVGMAVALFLLGVGVLLVAYQSKNPYLATGTIVVEGLLYWPIREIQRMRLENLILQTLPVMLQSMPKKEAAEEIRKLYDHLRS